MTVSCSRKHSRRPISVASWPTRTPGPANDRRQETTYAWSKGCCWSKVRSWSKERAWTSSRRGGPRLRVRDTPAPCRPTPGPQYGSSRRPDIPNNELRVRGPGVGGGVFQPAGVREHILPDHEPDRRGARGTRGQPRGRLRRGGIRERDRGTG